MRLHPLIAALVLLATPTLHAQQPSAAVMAAITQDPAPDKANPARFETFQLPSHGALLNAIVYVAAGPSSHPTVVLLHGFPGNEKNLDLAQSLRRAGWNVLFFNYRGSWGSPGEFSFTHCLEDAQTAIAYLRDPANAKRLHSDPANIALVGHSMGGFVARYVGAHDPAIKAIVLLSAADMVGRAAKVTPEMETMAIPMIAKGLAAEGMAPLAGTSPEALAKEVLANRADWTPVQLAPLLATRPVLVLTSDDGLAPSNDAVTAAIRQAGGTRVQTLHLTTDHSYSGQRIALQQAVLTFLAPLKPTTP
ncbi:Serine aminopeptidase, S33 [Granulicella pectinivorans]|uniref:Serine aminopeptidase, S33 n=1 Tax=Granulicella pectinivorans TaxID=474950 RepID=A0A1I6LZK4_9BACT|nr:alpha/beta hydrolase [Granulicella pectinivorans]SFS08818.1 Serine aminopeptidase, S33 [Granulicella pectinivorans]